MTETNGSKIIQLLSHDGQMYALTDGGYVLHLVGNLQVKDDGRLSDKVRWELVQLKESELLV